MFEGYEELKLVEEKKAWAKDRGFVIGGLILLGGFFILACIISTL